MTRFLPGLALVASVVTASTASAQIGPAPPNPLNDWVDACYATDPDLQALVEHNALIISAGALHGNLDGTYGLNTQPFTTLVTPHYPNPPEVLDYCPQGRFFGQPQVINVLPDADDLGRRSAVQVGSDLVLTTWHNPFDPIYLPDYLVVFGLHARNVGGFCVFPDFNHIPASQVYSLSAVAADGWSEGLDLLLLRLDRAVSDHYPRVRRSGRGWPGDDIAAIGHPQRLAAKVDRAGKAGETQIAPAGREWLDVEKVHLLPDSSGSMVYNRTQRVLETAAKTGFGLTFDWIPSQACYVINHQPGFLGRNASLRHFAQHIPAFELIVANLDPVVHVGSVGGGINDASSSRTVKAPPTAAGPLSYEIVPPPPFTPGQPTLLITPGGPMTGTLSPGAWFTIQQQAHIHGVGCGTYERSYEVRDLTNGFQDIARHRFEIGLSQFTVSPQRPGVFQDIAYPFESTDVYRLSNPRPDPVTVVVTANQSWVTLNGVPGQGGAPPSIELVLPPHTDGHVLTIGVADSMQQMAYGPYQAKVDFAFAPGSPCPAFDGPITRTFDFVYGRETFGSAVSADIPGAPGVSVSLNVPETFCVGDLNVYINTAGVPADHIIATLMSPQPTWQTVWNRESLSPPGAPLVVLLDDEASGPPFPSQPLKIFDNEEGQGAWVLNLVDAQPVGTAGRIQSWSLEFEACGFEP